MGVFKVWSGASKIAMGLFYVFYDITDTKLTYVHIYKYILIFEGNIEYSIIVTSCHGNNDETWSTVMPDYATQALYC